MWVVQSLKATQAIMTNSRAYSLQWLLLSLLITMSSFATVTVGSIWRLPGRASRRFMKDATTVSDDFQTYYYPQTLGHFTYGPDSYTIFQQRYLINYKYWGGAESCAPIFAYLGAEQEIDNDLADIGFLTENAAQFKALVVYMEHRFYGKSVPFGSLKKALENATLRGYFDSAQALADYAEILVHLKNKLNAHYSPIIVIGVSYGGILASWFRLKYPHVALGALASSAPVLQLDDLSPTGLASYYNIVTKDFREASESCFETIRDSWAVIDKVASQPDGLSILSKTFKTCFPLQDVSDLVQYLISSVYAQAAQYDQPPTYPVNAVCDAINGASFGNDILSRIFAGVVAASKLFPDLTAYINNSYCYVNPPNPPTETDLGWPWQVCSEIVEPLAIVDNSMLPEEPFNLTSFIQDCISTYGVSPRPYWITTYYGGPDIKLVLERFGSNIIFSNGLRDPFSGSGVLVDISDTILAVYTVNGSHGLDMLLAQPSDPDWLVKQRKIEIEIIQGWISKYYADLKDYKH